MRYSDAAQLRSTALTDNTGWQVVESLTTEVGPRPVGHDGTHYFDLHHNADDTLDKIDPQALAQNVAAYAVFTYLAAQADGDFGSSPERAQVRNRR